MLRFRWQTLNFPGFWKDLTVKLWRMWQSVTQWMAKNLEYWAFVRNISFILRPISAQKFHSRAKWTDWTTDIPKTHMKSNRGTPRATEFSQRVICGFHLGLCVNETFKVFPHFKPFLSQCCMSLWTISNALHSPWLIFHTTWEIEFGWHFI